MRILLHIALKSLLNRRITIILTIVSLTLSISLFLSIDTLRSGTKKSFFGNVKSGDLVLGAKSGEIQLILYSLFRLEVQQIILVGKAIKLFLNTQRYPGLSLFHSVIVISNLESWVQIIIISNILIIEKIKI